MADTSPKAEEFLKKRFRELREKAGLTQEAFAEHAKFSYKYYQGIEHGQWKNLRIRTIEKLAQGYVITLSELFGKKVPKPQINHESKEEIRAIIDAHTQKYSDFCSPSLVEMLLKLSNAVPLDYYREQERDKK